LTVLKNENKNWFITGYNIGKLPKFAMQMHSHFANAESMDTGISDQGVPWVTANVGEFAV